MRLDVFTKIYELRVCLLTWFFLKLKLKILLASYNDPNVNFDLESFYKRYQKFCIYEKELFPA